MTPSPAHVDPATVDLGTTAVIIPALNEAANLAVLLRQLQALNVGQILVCDNGSTDNTKAVVQDAGAQWVFESRRGYGAACFAGMGQLADSIDVVAFLDADLSDDEQRLPELVAPIASGAADFVVSARVPELRQPGSMTLGQLVANALFPALLRFGWGFRYTDLGPFRAIRRTSLERIGMKDRAYGWTIEMQIRAVELGLRIRELPVEYGKRDGKSKSKISGTVRGTVLAAYWITRTCLGLWWSKRSRRAADITDTQNR